jgi:hypothetical protein
MKLADKDELQLFFITSIPHLPTRKRRLHYSNRAAEWEWRPRVVRAGFVGGLRCECRLNLRSHGLVVIRLQVSHRAFEVRMAPSKPELFGDRPRPTSAMSQILP